MGIKDENLPKLLNTILNSFIELCGCDGGAIYTMKKDPKTGESKLAFAAMVTRSIKLQSVPDHLQDLTFSLDETTLVGRTATQRVCHKVSVQEQLREKATAERVDSILHYHTRNILSAPLITPRGDLVGVCQLLNKNPYAGQAQPDFDDRDERLFSIVSAQAAFAIENSLLLQEQERLLEGFVNACVIAVEARDPSTSGHSTRVADYSLELAQAVNRVKTGPLREVVFNETQLREVRFAAMLHDIGKISVKESVLMKEKKLHPWEFELIRMRLKWMRAELRLHAQKTGNLDRVLMQRLESAFQLISEANEPLVMPGEVSGVIHDLQGFHVMTEEGEKLSVLTHEEGFKLSILKGSLTSDERLEVERHVSHTYEILKMVPWSRGLEGVPEIAYRHHEKLDGTGYPCRCPADEIPLPSRLLTICDIFDALIADDRPYKRALPVEKALEILTVEVGTGKLDPLFFQVFLEAKIFEFGKSARRDEKRKKIA
ncbi:HD domain-containing phosphohydrolase [Bdellovibrionota bacterium FG-1]